MLGKLLDVVLEAINDIIAKDAFGEQSINKDYRKSLIKLSMAIMEVKKFW